MLSWRLLLSDSSLQDRTPMRLGLRAKLFGGFAAVLALLVVVAFIGYKNTTEFAADMTSLHDDRLVPLVQLDAAKTALFYLRVGYLTYGPADTAARAKTRSDDATYLKDVDDNIKAYAATYLVDEEKQGLKTWDQVYPEWLKTRQQIFTLFDEGKTDEANRLIQS